MRVVSPIPITDARLISSNVAEPAAGDPPLWNSATNYTLGVTAYRATTHRIYKRIVAGLTATAPENDLGGAAPNWQDIGPTLRWAMFDNEVNTRTSRASPLTVAIEPGQVDSLVLLELVGSTVSVEMTDGAAGPPVYAATFDLNLSEVTDWERYFFEPFRQRGSVLALNMPRYLYGRIAVTVTGPGDVACGAMIAGSAYYLGSTKYGASAGIRDYSRKSVNEDTGVVSLEKRKFAKLLQASLEVPAVISNATQLLLTELRSTPAVWIGDDVGDIEPLTVFGWYRDFSLAIAYPDMNIYSIEIEGMT